MKKNTYPVLINRQADAYREIFKDDTKPGRVKGINNSPNLVKLFPESPVYAKPEDQSHAIDDRGNLLADTEKTGVPLTEGIVANMFGRVIDGYVSGENQNTHIVKEGTSTNNKADYNYNWLYRDQPMDMNFRYLKDNGAGAFEVSSPNADTAPVGSNQPINNNELYDKPFWGHANLQVPSVNPELTSDAARPDHKDANGNDVAQLKRGTGGFGTTYSVTNNPFSAKDKIGKYFTESYLNTNNAGSPGQEIDRMKDDRFAGSSILITERGTVSANTPEGEKDIATFETPVITSANN